MGDLAAAKYLEENVGPALAKALADMSVAQPADAVAFLAQWLQQYADTEDASAARAKEQELLEKEREKKRAEIAAKEFRLQARKDELSAIDKARDDLKAKFDGTDEFQEGFWSELIQVGQRVSAGKALYIGIYDEQGEGAGCIRYEYASSDPDHSWMIDKQLNTEEGVTHGALKANATDEEIAGLYLHKPALKEDEKPPTYLPVYIECVTDCPKMKYFDMTRLGSYLAVPIVYTSYYSHEALEQAKAYKNTEAARIKLEEDYKAKVESGEELAEGEVPPNTEPEKLQLTGKDVKMVLCLDTLGTNVAFEPKIIPDLQMLCDAAAACKTRAEEKQVVDQASYQLEYCDKGVEIIVNKEGTGTEPPKYETMQNLYNQAATDAKDKMNDQFEKEKSELDGLTAGEDEYLKNVEEALGGKPLFEAKSELLEKKYNFLKARDVVSAMKEQILELKQWVVVPDEVNKIIAAAALLVRLKKEAVYMRKRDGLFWEKLKELLTPVFIDSIDKTDVAGVRKDLQQEQKMLWIKPLAFPGEYDETKAAELAPAFQALFVYVRAAYDYRLADVKYRKAEKDAIEKPPAEVVEGAPPPPEFDPANLDDDFADIAEL